MDIFDSSDLQGLIEERDGPCVSIFMPTHPTGTEGQQDRICLKSLLGKAENRLAEEWMAEVDARELLRSIRKQAEMAGFWESRRKGFALFLAPQRIEMYHLPISFRPQSVVGKRFHVKPLLPMLTAGNRFFVLTLSHNQVRLFSSTSYSIETVEVPGLPENMEKALSFSEADRGLQLHSPVRMSQGKRTAIFHGQGGEADTGKEDLRQYFQMIDKALYPVLGGEKVPLLLAGVEYLLPIYREVNSYAETLEEELPGNWDEVSANQLREVAWPLVEPSMRQQKTEAVEKYVELTGSGNTSADIHKILVAAENGQIETLFVDINSTVWGRYQAETGELYVHDDPEAGDEELLNLAVIQTIKHRGEVYVVPQEEIPNRDFIAATFRY